VKKKPPNGSVLIVIFVMEFIHQNWFNRWQ